MFASNAFFWWATAIRAGGVVRWPYGAAETAPVDDRDVAAVAARTLCQDGHAGGDYVLTGPESLSQAEQVSIIGDVLGRRIKFEELSPDEFRGETEGSWPRPVVDMRLAAWGATIGRPAFIPSTVSGILGSAPRSFRQLLLGSRSRREPVLPPWHGFHDASPDGVAGADPPGAAAGCFSRAAPVAARVGAVGGAGARGRQPGPGDRGIADGGAAPGGPSGAADRAVVLLGRVRGHRRDRCGPGEAGADKVIAMLD